MTLTLSTLKKSGRAAVVALAMGAVSMTAMPVQAASEPSFNFQLGIGNDGGVMGFELNKKSKKGYYPIKRCLTDRQVERGLEYYGFDDADVVRKLSKSRVLVVAEWNNRFYSLTVNKCTGEVYNVKRLRKGYDFYEGPHKGPKNGFGFQKDGFSFQFGF
ncbi:MAG: hypothetical protein EOP21_06195 [Hyphomicrobiales bacterium]|nr:MAG: hypothetical protein EOP21_06195 [Hyphomicrobiales bacterium]